MKDLLSGPLRNGVYKKKEFHGRGNKVVNMGELFAHSRLFAIPMKRVELNPSEQRRYSLARGDLIFARRSLVAEGAGKCSIVLEVDEPTVFESSIIRARPNPKKAEPLYLYYFFNSPEGRYRLSTIRRHVAVAGITGGDLKELQVKVPPLMEQRAIIAILAALDDKIELNRRMSETLEDIATTIFHSWFVAFDGAEQLVQSSLGLTPEDWRVEPLGNLIQVSGGATPSTKEPRYWDDGHIPWATPKDLSGHEGPILLTTARRVTEAGLERISSGLLPKGTLLFSSRAPIGYRALAGQATAVNQGFIAVPPGGDLSPTYMYFWTHANLDVIKGHAGGSTFAEISKRAFKSIPTVLPPMDLRLRFDEVAGMLLKRCELLARESTTLIELRDAFLPKLISGELRVPQAEQLVSEVV